MSLLVVNERGVPQPSEAVASRLRGLDPCLGLRCYQWGVTQQWALVYAWRDTDPRRARIQTGELDPNTAVDIIGYLPLDCSPEQACASAERGLTAMTGVGYDYVDALLAKVRNHNQAVKEGVWAPTMERANDAIETKASGLFSTEKGRIAKSSGFGKGKKS